MYQPWIWKPSRTLRRSHPGPRGLYQPGIWHSSRTRKISRAWYFSLYLLERVYCDKGAKTATRCEMGCELRIEISIFRIGEAFRCASRLVFAITKRHSNRWNAVLQGIHCINLESGHLRGPNSRSGSKKSNYINLGSGDLRGLRDAVKYDLGDCINLGFGYLRGPDAGRALRGRYCINLGFGYLRGLIC